VGRCMTVSRRVVVCAAGGAAGRRDDGEVAACGTGNTGGTVADDGTCTGTAAGGCATWGEAAHAHRPARGLAAASMRSR
jgi:hypothetical protein